MLGVGHRKWIFKNARKRDWCLTEGGVVHFSSWQSRRYEQRGSVCFCCEIFQHEPHVRHQSKSLRSFDYSRVTDGTIRNTRELLFMEMTLWAISKMWVWAESHQNNVIFSSRVNSVFCLPSFRGDVELASVIAERMSAKPLWRCWGRCSGIHESSLKPGIAAVLFF